MATQPLGSPRVRYFDSNGDPLSGGLLYSYEAGTSTPLPTYTTRAGDVANAHPVVLDANGEASVWMTPGVLYKFELRTSAGVVQWTVDNFPSPADPDTTYDVATDPGGRLTLETAVPVSTSDQSGKTTIYYTPHKHNRIPIYNGTEWVLETFSELSQTTTDTTRSPAAVANDTVYDLYVWNNGGTITLSRGAAWSSATSRGTGAGTAQQVRLNGRLVNAVSITNGPAANRGTYVGTVRSNGSAQLTDTAAARLVWNAYNWQPRELAFHVNFGTYNYTTNTVRQANNTSSYRVEVVVGLDEAVVDASLHAFYTQTAAGNEAVVGFGLDSTTAISSRTSGGAGESPASSVVVPLVARFTGPVGIGYHALNWLETAFASGTTTWQYAYGPSSAQALSGIRGTLLG